MRSFVVTAPAGESELAADALWALGVCAVEERASAASSSDVELWTAVADDEVAVKQAVSALRAGWTWRVETLDAEPVETWRDHARPVSIGNSVMIIPAWQDPPVPSDITPVYVEPEASFGLGDHPTTRLALAHLVAAVGERPDARVLDVGCGSGVLAITAVLRGALCARAVDVSPAAVEATRHNALRNDVEALLEVDGTEIGALGGAYDIVAANILAPVLVSMAPELRRVTDPGGLLIVSGVLADRHDHVLDALAPLVAVETSETEGWAAITLQMPS
jgi:ribosomal protein L11 methyltransferase